MRALSFALIAPALLLVGGLFVLPLGFSLISAVSGPEGPTAAHLIKAVEMYGGDILFSAAVILLATALIGLMSVGIGAYLTLGRHPRIVAALRWLYRWPLFIPFVVAGQCMRTFLAKNGMLNNTLSAAGLLDPLHAVSFLDWRGIVITFVWKQTAFAALLVAGAMASLDRATLESARNLGAGSLRITWDILVPQVRTSLVVALVLSFVTMLSVLSVPMMVGSGTPTMMTVDMAFRINAYGDYPVANALGFISAAFAGLGAWVYLRHGLRQGGAPK